MGEPYSELEETFIIDAVAHNFNLDPSNYYHDHAKTISELAYGLTETQPDEYRITMDSYLTKWEPDYMPNLVFGESYTDFATNHALPVTAFEDGMAGHVETAKALEEEYSNRIMNYAGVSPLNKNHPIQVEDDPVEEFERQVEEMDVQGLKLYPNHWDRNDTTPIPMDDPEIAYPLYEKALDLGITAISVHKALPLGPTPLSYQDPTDVGNAAADFPELDFEIVHGGLTFAEEIGAAMAAQPNIYVNFEFTSVLAHSAPNRFIDIISELLKHTGSAGIERLFWGTGAGAFHPRPLLEAFWDLDFPEIEGYYETFDITKEDKKKILGENYAQMHGLEIDDLRDRIGEDRFSRQGSMMEPWSDFEKKMEA